MPLDNDGMTMTEVEEERKQYKTMGCSGLENLGNTCYMNSALQCLISTDILVPYFRGTKLGGTPEYVFDLKQGLARIIAEDEIKKRKAKFLEIDGAIEIDKIKIKKKFRESLTYEFKKIVMTMWGIMCVVKPSSFKSALERASSREKTDGQHAEFSGSQQCDSQECVSFILDRIHEETRTDVVLGMKPLSPEIEEALQVKNSGMAIEDYNVYKKEHLKECAIVEALDSWKKYIEKSHSIIEDIFGGMYYQSITCSGCGNISLKYDPFKLITLHIPSESRSGPITMNTCLEDYFKDEKMEDGCQYACETCKTKTDALKSFKIWHSPHRLLICFKRFDYSGVGTKNGKKIIFPITELDMGKYVSDFAGGSNMYDLYAISYHSGSVRCGHYTAYTKSAMNGEWYHYDDSNVMHVNLRLTATEFEDFFKERLTKDDIDELKVFIGKKVSINKRNFSLTEVKDFLAHIGCHNMTEIIEEFELAVREKLENVLVTPGAYWLMYKKRDKFVFPEGGTDESDEEDSI